MKIKKVIEPKKVSNHYDKVYESDALEGYKLKVNDDKSVTCNFNGLEECNLDKLNFCSDKTHKTMFLESCDEMEHHSKFQEGNIESYGNSLISTIIIAYNYHKHLVLRPDDVWTNIIINLGIFIQNNSEKMKNIFVDFKGKKSLFACGLEINGTDKFEVLINNMANEINKNVKDDFVDWLKPNFTTTTDDDIFMSKIVLMGSMKNYFNYGFVRGCGLKEITLKGNIDDWILIKNKIKKIHDYKIKELSQYIDALDYVLNEFIEMFLGNVNEGFWQRICSYLYRGSGGEQSYSGWCLVFAGFNKQGKLIINELDEIKKTLKFGSLDDDEICETYISSLASIEGSDDMYDLFAGQIFTLLDKKNNIILPKSDWFIIRRVVKLKFDNISEYLEKYINSLVGKKMTWSAHERNISENNLEKKMLDDQDVFNKFLKDYFVLYNKLSIQKSIIDESVILFLSCSNYKNASDEHEMLKYIDEICHFIGVFKIGDTWSISFLNDIHKYYTKKYNKNSFLAEYTNIILQYSDSIGQVSCSIDQEKLKKKKEYFKIIKEYFENK